MCRPPCCNDSGSGGGLAIAAIAAVLIGAAVIDKAAPVLAQTVKIAVEVIRIGLIVTLSAATCAAITWITVRVVRWRAKRRHSAQPAPSCAECGNTGEVLWAGEGGRFELAACTGCQPAERAG